MKNIQTLLTLLNKFDPQYFTQDIGNTYNNAILTHTAYSLATWFYDHQKVSSLRKMIDELPQELWVLALKKWASGDHDT